MLMHSNANLVMMKTIFLRLKLDFQRASEKKVCVYTIVTDRDSVIELKKLGIIIQIISNIEKSSRYCTERGYYE